MVFVRFAFFALCFLGLAGAASAAPTPVNGAAAAIKDTPDCVSVHKRFDADREKMELLMGAMQNEDAKPESPARFKRMCAIDRSISDAARRLSSLISGSGKSCLSSDDRSQAAQMRHLSEPIPECAGAGAVKAKAARGKQSKAVAITKTRKIVAVNRAPALRKIKQPAHKGTHSLGLMSDLY